MYYWWQNLKGIEESSDKALEVMKITTVMVVILLTWGIYSAFHVGAKLPPWPTPSTLHFSKDALGFLKYTRLPAMLGLFGIIMAFGHSVLAMSGEETLAQVNREIEHPKLKNLKRAAIVIAIYSFLFTGLGSLLAVMLIPDSVRVPVYRDNLIAGTGDVHGWPPGAADYFPRLCGAGRLPNSLRRDQHFDHRFHRRTDAHRRGWSAHGLVP